MNVKEIIVELLSERALVIIPDFGAFLSEEVPASFNIGGSQISAPSKTIRFNSILKKNDGVLQTEIAFRSHVSNDLALDIIKTQVEEWKSTLRSGGIVKIAACGLLSLDDEGHVSFSPSESGIHSIKNFGLDAIQLKLIDRLVEHTNSEVRNDVVLNETQQIFNELPLESENIQYKIEERRKRGRRTRTLIMSLLLSGIIGTTQLAIFTDSPVKLQFASTLPIWKKIVNPENSNKVLIEDKRMIKWEFSDHLINHNASLPTKTEKNVNAPKNLAEQKIEVTKTNIQTNPASQTQTSLSANEQFVIVIGCFKDPSNIERLSNNLASKGKSIYKSSLSKGMIQIGYYAGITKEAASAELIRAKEQYKDAWLKK